MVARLGRKVRGWRGRESLQGPISYTMTFPYTESTEVLTGERIDVVVQRALHSLKECFPE